MYFFFGGRFAYSVLRGRVSLTRDLEYSRCLVSMSNCNCSICPIVMSTFLSPFTTQFAEDMNKETSIILTSMSNGFNCCTDLLVNVSSEFPHLQRYAGVYHPTQNETTGRGGSSSLKALQTWFLTEVELYCSSIF